MRPSVYLETTIPSYLTARRSRDLLISARQIATQEWWVTRTDFEMYTSQLVIDEASAGDRIAAMRRLEALQNLPLLDVTEQVDALAQQLITGVPMHGSANADAYHIAVAAVGGMEYLLTWNMTHIANAAFRKRIDQVCRSFQVEPPTICTPDELMTLME